jgi:hypothetical protein
MIMMPSEQRSLVDTLESIPGLTETDQVILRLAGDLAVERDSTFGINTELMIYPRRSGQEFVLLLQVP